jgi:hypothetical protein
LDSSVRPCGRARGVAGVGVVYHEVLHCQGRHGKLPPSNPSASRGISRLSNNQRHQKVSPRKLVGHQYSLGRRNLGTLGPHHLVCFLLQHFSTNSRRTNTLENTNAPGRAPATTDGTAAQIRAARHVWEEDVQTYWTYTSVQQAFNKQIISVFEPMYLEILNDNMVGYTNVSARDMFDQLFETYGNTTAVDLEINVEHMRQAWDPQKPVETLFKQIQDYADYSEAGSVLIGPSQQINIGMQTYLQHGTS